MLAYFSACMFYLFTYLFLMHLLQGGSIESVNENFIRTSSEASLQALTDSV